MTVKTPEELQKFAKDFNPVTDDSEFLQSLYKRSETLKKIEEMKTSGQEIKLTGEHLRFRHGLAPVTKNIRNIRYKKE